MSVTKELIEKERQLMQTGQLRDVHLHREGTFLRSYDWSAWLCCRYLHDFKVNKRVFKGIDAPVAYIGFPETSLMKWMPEGAEQRVELNQAGRFSRSFLKYSSLTVPTGIMPAGTVAKDRECITQIATAAKRIRQPSATEG